MRDLTDLACEVIDRFNLTRKGMAETAIPGVLLFHADRRTERGPLLYHSGIVFIVSGRKRAYLHGRTLVYDASNYLTLGLPLAMECETLASENDPLFAIYVKTDPPLVRDVAAAMNVGFERSDTNIPSVSVAPLLDEMSGVLLRLLRVLLSDVETAVLGTGLVREAVFRALQGPGSPALRGLLKQDGNTSRIAKVMHQLITQCERHYSVEEMAKMAGMSASVFHRAFRQLTDDTPLQYLKKVRLTKAGRLLAYDGYRVGVAAGAVGYESVAHFSRDFRGYHGVSARQAKELGQNFTGARNAI